MGVVAEDVPKGSGARSRNLPEEDSSSGIGIVRDLGGLTFSLFYLRAERKLRQALPGLGTARRQAGSISPEKVRLAFEQTVRKKRHFLGPQVVSQLTGRAWAITGDLDHKRLCRRDGVVYLLQHLKESLRPKRSFWTDLRIGGGRKTRKDSDSDTSEKALEDLQIWESQEEQLPEDRGLGLAPPTTSGIGQSSPVIRPSSCRE